MFKKENLRKNFLRVKQNIDQNLGRSEKSEVLTEEQQENEKRVDVVKHAVQNIVKKAGAVLQAPGTDYEKRLKKLPETGLHHALVESAQHLGPETLLGSACQLCGDVQMDIAREQVNFETTVEGEVLAPLQHIVDIEIPTILKFRKALNKSTLDMDSAKNRFNQAVRQSSAPGANMAKAAAQADVIRDEMEEAENKMEHIRDSLSISLCNFAAKESEHSSRLLIFLEAQAEYHKKALQMIEENIPKMRMAIANSPAKPCYGMPLEEHLRIMCRDIAIVLEACVLTLLDIGMEEEGLFRIAGAAMKLKKLKANFDANAVDMEEFEHDPHTVAGCLKQYLRELPEPLLTFALYNEFLGAVTIPDQDQRLQALWVVIHKLPKPNYNNFRYLTKFLAKLAEKSDINKMKPSNIAIVIGPNLLWAEGDNAPNMQTTGSLSSILEAVVAHADWFFPGELDFTNVGYLYEDDQEPKGFNLDQSNLDISSVQMSSPSSVSYTTASPSASPAPSTHSSTGSLPMDSPDPSVRRGGRKPAPPPPAERPYTVNVTAVTANTSGQAGGDTGGSGTVHSGRLYPSISVTDDSSSGSDRLVQQGMGAALQMGGTTTAPLASPEPSAEYTQSPRSQSPPPVKDRDRKGSNSVHGTSSTSGSLRMSMPPPERPVPAERPKIPAALTASKGHQRSASTGTMINPPLTPTNSCGLPNAGSVASPNVEGEGFDSIEGGDGSTQSSILDNMQGSHAMVAPGMSSTLGRNSTMRPRPSPPPPPIARESEDTKM